MINNKICVGISQGDINGVGYEVILKTLSDSRVYENKAIVIYGSSKIAAYYKKVLNIENVNFTTIKSASEAIPGRLSIINCIDENIKVEIGQSTKMAGLASFQALNAAVSDLKAGNIDVLVTAPINKNNIQSDKFKFPGHTEYIETEAGKGDKALMMMASPIMKIAVATGHVPISKVAENLSVDNIVEKLSILKKSLITDFSIDNPIIAVLGLNPHAGDNGVIGNEDDEIIAKAIKIAQEKNIVCFGPIPADGFFGSGEFKKYDGILAMYHDQGLIPFKVLSMDSGVNFTSGLPVIRTSPDHGTAYGIAGKNLASPDSFRDALFMACDIFNNRKIYSQISANPLRKVYRDKRNVPDLTISDEKDNIKK